MMKGCPTGPRFVASDAAVRLATTAAKWGQRPSQMLGLTEPVTALALDEALAVRLTIEEMRAMTQGSKRQQAANLPGQQLPEGMRYATEADLERW